MRGSVVDAKLAPCCQRTIRGICDDLERGGVSHVLFSSGALAAILNPNPPTGTISVSAADWNLLVDAIADCEEDDKDACEQAASGEVIKHQGSLGMFWRSLADCFSSTH